MFLFLITGLTVRAQQIDSLFKLAQQKIHNNEYETSFKLFDSLSSLNISDSLKSYAYFKMGFIKRYAVEMIDYNLSREYYEKSIEINPKNAFAYTQLSILYRRQFSDIESALLFAKKATEVDPDCTMCFFNYALYGYYFDAPEHGEKYIESLKKIIGKPIDLDLDNRHDDLKGVLVKLYLANLLVYELEALNFDDKDLEKERYYWNESVKYYNEFTKEFDFIDQNKDGRNDIVNYVAEAYSQLNYLYRNKSIFLKDLDHKKNFEIGLKYLDSAAIAAVKWKINPSPYIKEKLSTLNYDGANIRAKETLEELKKYELFDYDPEVYNDLLQKKFNLPLNWKKIYPYESINLKKMYHDLPWNHKLSIFINDISGLTMGGSVKDRFFIDYNFTIENWLEGDIDHINELIEEGEIDTDTIALFNFKKEISTQQINLESKEEVRYEFKEEYYSRLSEFRVKSEIAHVWDLRDYPFDKQKLKIIFNSEVDTSFYRLKESQLFESKFSNNLSLEKGYSIDKINFREEFIQDNKEVQFFITDRKPVYSSGVFEVIISRSGGWLFIKLFLGAILSYIISCLVFLIPKENFGSRIDLTLGAIFGSIGNKYFVEASTSMAQVLTKADLINNLIIFLVLFNVIVVILQDNKKIDFGLFEKSSFSLAVSFCLFAFISLFIILS